MLISLLFISACGGGFQGARIKGGKLEISDDALGQGTRKPLVSGSQDYYDFKSLPTLEEIDQMDITRPIADQIAALAATELNMPAAKMVIDVDHKTMTLSAEVGIGSVTEHIELKGDFKASYDANLGYWASTNMKAVDPELLKARRVQATSMCLRAGVCDEVVVELYFLNNGKLYRRQFNQHLNTMIVGNVESAATSKPTVDSATSGAPASSANPANSSAPGVAASTPQPAPAAPASTKQGATKSTPPTTSGAFANWVKGWLGSKPTAAGSGQPANPTANPPTHVTPTPVTTPVSTPVPTATPAPAPVAPVVTPPTPNGAPAPEMSPTGESATDDSEESEPAGIEGEYIMPEATVDADSIPELAKLVADRHAKAQAQAQAQMPPHSDTPDSVASLAPKRVQAMGQQNHGSLLNGKLLPENGLGYIRNVPSHIKSGVDVSPSYGTDIVVQFLLDAAKALGGPGGAIPKMIIGQIANMQGGPICNPDCAHKHSVSHQNGLDADVGFFALTISHSTFWSPLPDAKQPHQTFSDYDFARNWALLKMATRYGRTDLSQASLNLPGSLDGILTDAKIKQKLCEYADGLGERPRIGGSEANIILNRIEPYPQHQNHFHMRFLCPNTHLGCHDIVIATKNGPGC